jgi:hypothetical protein
MNVVKNQKEIIATLCLLINSSFFFGCVRPSQHTLVYQRQIQTIEEAYQKGEITKADYLKMKMDAENAYQQRRATYRAGAMSTPIQQPQQYQPYRYKPYGSNQ